MPLAGDVLQIKMFQELVGIEGEILNVFYYQCGSTVTPWTLNDNAEGFTDSWAEVIISLFTPLQTAQLTHTRLEVNNLMAFATDFFNHPYDAPIPGAVGFEYMSPATAYSIQLTRTFRTTRHGSKRVAGVPEPYVANNALAGSAITLMPSLVGTLGGPIFIEYNSSFDPVELEPVILKSPVLTTPPTIINPVSGAIFRGIGSQNTRKQLLA